MSNASPGQPERARGPRLSIIPAGAITDRTLDGWAFKVLCLLGRHTDQMGWCRRSQVRMARELGCGRSSVQRGLEQLVEAGWVQIKRAAWDADEAKQPSASYAYRVVLDRDEAAFEAESGDDQEPVDAAETAAASVAENACPQPENPPSAEGGVPTGGHPGAQPGRAPVPTHGRAPYNDPLERPPVERERDAGAREGEKKALNDFELRWPTAAADDRHRTAYAIAALSEADRKAAIDGIAPFLAHLKKLKRDRVPAGWKYLEDRRWEMLDKPAAAEPEIAAFAATTPQGRALATLHRIGRAEEFFFKAVCRSGTVYWRGTCDPQLLALAGAPPPADWPALSHQQAGAWEALLGRHLKLTSRRRLVEGDRAPWCWPPKVDGTLCHDPPAEAGEGESGQAGEVRG